MNHLASYLPIPAPDAHKYSRGKAIVVAGAKPYPGAACLSAKASQYAGAGYTQVFTDASHVSLLQAWRPSLVVNSFAEFNPAAQTAGPYPKAVLIGPGFVAGDETLDRLVRRTVKKVEVPLLIDGGALAALTTAKAHSALLHRYSKGRITVMTPHAGEAARLAQAVDIVTPKPAAPEQLHTQFAQELANTYGAVVVLKGANTYIAAPEHSEIIAVTSGTAVLAKAGTGDILAGLIAGLLAQGLEPLCAAQLGCELHAHAGNCAAERYGLISACAEEVLECVPAAIMQLAN